jgi:hypothetical protein
MTMKIQDIDWPEDMPERQREAVVWYMNKYGTAHNKVYRRWFLFGLFVSTVIIVYMWA